MSNALRKHLKKETPKGINSISQYPRKSLNFSSRKDRQIADYIDKQFAIFSKKWAEETQYMSSSLQIKNNENYICLIQLGKPIIPLILNEIKNGNTEPLWAFLLSDIVGYNPVPFEFFGKFDLMHGYWVKWAEEKQFIV